MSSRRSLNFSGPHDYSDDEWHEVLRGELPLSHLDGHQVALLHRHWLWADYARRRFERAFASRDQSVPPWDGLYLEWACAMYTWHSLLWSVIEGVRQRRVAFGSPLARDIRLVADALRDGRNATFHVGAETGYFDERLFRVMESPNSVQVIHRVHRGLERLVGEELRPVGQTSSLPPGRPRAGDPDARRSRRRHRAGVQGALPGGGGAAVRCARVR